MRRVDRARLGVVIGAAAALAVSACGGSPSGSVIPPQTASPSGPVVASPTTSRNPTPVSTRHSLVDEFVNSAYRVLGVVENTKAPYYLIIATERARADCGSEGEPERCVNDAACGSMYTSEYCYFFVEPAYANGADPQTRFVARWRSEKDEMDSLEIASIRFLSASRMRFQSSGGDGCVGVSNLWELNLTDGAIRHISRDEDVDCGP